MQQSVEINSVKWVLRELQPMLKNVQRALEACAEHPAQLEELRSHAEVLQQVKGTLQLVELHGAAMLADEMARLTLALIEGLGEGQENALETLMRAALQLPDYLERVHAGSRDVPLVLLPILNELRSTRQAEAFNEPELFFPDLNAVPVAAVQSRITDGKSLQIVARALRRRYQNSLLQWLRTPQDLQHLQAIDSVIADLEAASVALNARRLWFIFRALLQSVVDGGLASAALKSFVGQVDRLLRVLVETGEQTFSEAIPFDLLKSMLYQVARSTSTARRVNEVRATYQLARLLPSAREIEVARETLAGPNLELLAVVNNSIKEDISQIKDAVEIYVHGKDHDRDKLKPMEELLGRVTDTVGMLGINKAKDLLQAQIPVVRGLMQQQQHVSASQLMSIAGVLLQAEEALDEYISQRADLVGTGTVVEDATRDFNIAALPGPEFHALLSAVIREALGDLAKAREAMLAYLANPSKLQTLEVVPALLDEVNGAMFMLPLEKVIPLLRGLASYLRLVCIQSGQMPDAHRQNQIADIVATIEYYLEAVEQGRGDMTHILSAGEVALRELQTDMQANSAVNIEPVPTTAEANAAVENIEIVEPAPPTSSHSNVIDLSSAKHETPGIKASEITASRRAVSVAPSAPKAVETHDALPILADDVDEEILEVFLEEAVTELEQISKSLPVWRQNPDDEEALVRIRRAFHTLKGSGRVIGAELIGEFSWSLESLLNQVLAKRIQATPKVFDLLNEAVGVLPQLIEQLRGNQEPVEQVGDLISRAYALATGNDDDDAEPANEEPEPELHAGSLISDTVIELPPTPPRPQALPPVFDDSEPPQLESMEIPVVDVDAVTSEEPVADTPAEETVTFTETQEPALISFEVAAIDDAILESPAEIVFEDAADTEAITPAAPQAALPQEPVTVQTQVTETLPPRAFRTTLETLRITAEEPVMDPVLLDIFTKESESHLAILSRLLRGAAEQNNILKVSEELVRALHTLHGSAQTAEVEDVAVLSGALEKIAKTKQELGKPFDPEETELVSECMLAMQQTLKWFAGQAERPRNIHELEAQLRVFEKRVEGETAAAEAQDDELLDIFIEEGDELLEASDRLLSQWRERPGETTLIHDLQRQLHTLKGGARMANFTPIADLAHALETLVIRVSEASKPPDSATFDLLHEAVDALTVMLEQARSRQPVSRVDWLLDELTGNKPTLETTPPPLPPVAITGEVPAVSIQEAPAPAEEKESKPFITTAEVPVEPPPPVQEAAMPSPAAEPAAPAAGAGAAQEQIRVRADLLDNLVNYAGEVNIYHSRLGQQVNDYRFNLEELDGTVFRLREQLRQMELETEAQILFRYEKEGDQPAKDFDPLELDRYSRLQELSRALAESVNDLESIKGILGDITRDSETLLLQQSRVGTDLQEGLMRTRMVKFDRLSARLARVVRQTAMTLGKKAELTIQGGNTEIDRSVQDRMIAPLEHMLRNAISHGIELPAERRRLGKPQTGSIDITLGREGGDILLIVQDDGAGINLDAVRARAVAQGLIARNSKLNDEDLLKLILETGMSTAKEVTQISGRGVGMDVVSQEIKQLGGSLDIKTEAGVGTKFTVRLPLTLAINQALLVEAAGEVYAIPLTSIIGITQVNSATLQKYYVDNNLRYSYADGEFEVQHLGSLLKIGSPRLAEGHEVWPLVMIRAGDHRLALHVEALVGRREIVIKPVGPQISTISGISGASILPDGRVVLILDLGAMMRAADAFQVLEEAAPKPEEAREGVTVMVVDDSITIRKVTQRMLERHGINVVTAKDGVDAVTLLADLVPDLILLDIEMPRMDGYEVATYVRNTDRLRTVPIIMITSRTGEKHRKRAAEIGVNEYLGKPYQETELLEHINNMLALEV